MLYFSSEYFYIRKRWPLARFCSFDYFYMSKCKLRNIHCSLEHYCILTYKDFFFLSNKCIIKHIISILDFWSFCLFLPFMLCFFSFSTVYFVPISVIKLFTFSLCKLPCLFCFLWFFYIFHYVMWWKSENTRGWKTKFVFVYSNRSFLQKGSTQRVTGISEWRCRTVKCKDLIQEN